MSYLRAAATRASGELAAEELFAELGADRALIFAFASPKRGLPEVVAALAERCPEAVVVGCTTMGELAPEGFSTEAVAALGLAAPARAAAVLVEDLEDFEVTDASAVLAELGSSLGVQPDPDRHVLITLTDGLSGLEELLVASLALAAPGLALVGGSAGDDFAFDHTEVAVGERSSQRGAAVVLLEPGVPFHPFRAHNFEPTDTRVVVTEADPVRRRVYELDGVPGPQRLAELLGVEEEELEPSVAIDAVFGFGTHAHPFLRSVMAVQDGALVMGGAVERGAVLTLMHGESLVERTERQVREAVDSVEDPAGMLLFWCGGRQLEAVGKGITAEVHAALTPVPAAGFVTYGEHFGAQQVNHTLTGLVLGGDGE